MDAMQSSTPFPLFRTFLSGIYRKSRFLAVNYSLSVGGLLLAIIGLRSQNLLLRTINLTIGIAAIIAPTAAWYRAVQDLRIRDLPPLNQIDVSLLRISRRLRASNYELRFRESTLGDALLTSMTTGLTPWRYSPSTLATCFMSSQSKLSKRPG